MLESFLLNLSFAQFLQLVYFGGATMFALPVLTELRHRRFEKGWATVSVITATIGLYVPFAFR